MTDTKTPSGGIFTLSMVVAIFSGLSIGFATNAVSGLSAGIAIFFVFVIFCFFVIDTTDCLGDIRDHLSKKLK